MRQIHQKQEWSMEFCCSRFTNPWYMTYHVLPFTLCSGFTMVQSGPHIPSIQMGVHVCWALFPTKFIPFPADAEIFLNNPVVLFEPMAAIPFQPSHVKILTRCPRKVENDAADAKPYHALVNPENMLGLETRPVINLQFKQTCLGSLMRQIHQKQTWSMEFCCSCFRVQIYNLPRAFIYPLFWLHVVQSGPRIPSIQMGVHVCWALFPTKFIPFPADAEIFLNNPVVLFEPMAAIPFQPSHVKILTRCLGKVENDAVPWCNHM